VELSMIRLLDMLSCGLKRLSLFYSVAVYTETRIKAMLRNSPPCVEPEVSLVLTATQPPNSSN